jgi:ABC-type lipoprotein export system ATPase subunit
MAIPIIQTIDIHRTFEVGEILVEALRGVDLTVNQGDFVVILGASGSGKTTLLNQIGGIDQPSSGQVIVDGEDVSNYNDKQMTEHRRSKIGWIFQFHNLIPSLTATENVQLALEMMNVTELQREREGCWARRRIGSFSGAIIWRSTTKSCSGPCFGEETNHYSCR